jgi:hypothetical protein
MLSDKDEVYINIKVTFKGSTFSNRDNNVYFSLGFIREGGS